VLVIVLQDYQIFQVLLITEFNYWEFAAVNPLRRHPLVTPSMLLTFRTLFPPFRTTHMSLSNF